MAIDHIGEMRDMKNDLVSRQAAIEALRTCYDTEAITYTNGNEYIDYDQALDLINTLPPVQPKPKTEKCKWVRYDYRTICPQNHDIDNPYWRIPEKRMEVLKYCPYCGKEIEVEE